jgi:hypothetical protein
MLPPVMLPVVVIALAPAAIIPMMLPPVMLPVVVIALPRSNYTNYVTNQ